MSKAQIQAYLKFFSSKRDVSVSEIDGMFSDVQDARLSDDMFSKDEVVSVLASLKVEVKSVLRRELEKSCKMGAVVLERVLATAEAGGVDVSVDMSKAEDEAAISKLGTGEVLTEADAKRLSGAVRLDSLRDEHSRAIAESQRLKEENAALKDKYQAMQARATSALKDVTDLNQEVARLTQELEREKSDKCATTVLQSQAGEVAALKEQVRKLEVDLSKSESAVKEARGSLSDKTAQLDRALAAERAAQAEKAAAVAEKTAAQAEKTAALAEKAAALADLAAALEKADKASTEAAAPAPATQSKQFQQLKAMLDKKNAQLTETRRRLAKYEPDDAAAADDDDGPSGK